MNALKRGGAATGARRDAIAWRGCLAGPLAFRFPFGARDGTVLRPVAGDFSGGGRRRRSGP